MHVQLQHSYFSPIRSGQERRMHVLAQELLAAGHKVSVLVSEEGFEAGAETPQGVTLHVHPRFFSSGLKILIDPYLYPRKLQGFLKSLYLRDEPDVVLSFNIFYAVATKRVRPRLPLAYLTGGAIQDWYSWLSGHSSGLRRRVLQMRTPLAQSVEREVLRNADRVVAETKRIEKRLEELNPGIRARFMVRATPVDRELFKPCDTRKAEVRRELGIGAREKLLLCVGRLQWNKNFSLVIKALAAVRSRDFQLLIVGEGPDLEKLKGLAVEAGLGERVKLLGFRANMERVYSAADIFVHPALVEPFGNVVQEAMASGLACVVSGPEYIGFSEYLTDGVDAFVADPQAVGPWTEKLERLITDDALRSRLGAAARSLVESRPDWAQYADDLLRALVPK